jgi:hypothetical protein
MFERDVWSGLEIAKSGLPSPSRANREKDEMARYWYVWVQLGTLYEKYGY